MKRSSIVVVLASLLFLSGCGQEKEASVEGDGKIKPAETAGERPVKETPKQAEGEKKPEETSGSSGEEDPRTPVQAEQLDGDMVEPEKRPDDASLYEQLQAKLSFTLLYPGYVPNGFTIADRQAPFQGVNNGVPGFEVHYANGDTWVRVMEGSVFNPASGSKTETIETRQGTAYLETLDTDRFAVYLTKAGTKFGLMSKGISKDELRKIATALVPLADLR
ncbi:MAG: hypothetical protein ACYC1U_00760 [Candidatus Aquicultorales bacterium]